MKFLQVSKKLLTDKKIFDIIILENNKEVKSVSELVGFFIVCIIILIASIVAVVAEEVEKVSIIRHKKRAKFLKEHPNVAQDSKGNLTIL